MDLPVFALHRVLFPGERLGLRVFEPRYLAMMRTVLPDGTFVVAAIRRGSEVGGPADPYRVGVTVAVRDHRDGPEGTIELDAVGLDRVTLLEETSSAPYPVWGTEPFPDEGGAGSDAVEATTRSFHRFLEATGLPERLPGLPRQPVLASYVLAAAVPALIPQRQRFLEAPGAGERLRMAREAFVMERRLLSTLHAGVGDADTAVNLN